MIDYTKKSLVGVNMINCKGCLIGNLCGYKSVAKTKKCPCRMCLIKVVCKTACEEYTQFMNIVDKEEDEKWKTVEDVAHL